MRLRSGLLILIIFAAGCAGTKTIVNEDYSANSNDKFEIEILNTASATEAGLRVFENQLSTYDAPLKVDASHSNRIVTIEFTLYHVRHGAARAFAGVMAGSDNVTTVTTVKDSETGDVLGRVTHITKNPTAVVGINSLLKGHADKIAKYLLLNQPD